MRLLVTALGLSLLGGCGGLLVASSLLLFPDRVRSRLVPWLVSYAVGALLGVALLDLLPEALRLLPSASVFGTLLAGILLFFALEKLVLLRHCHTDECEVHGATATLVFIGDALPQLHRRCHHRHGGDVVDARSASAPRLPSRRTRFRRKSATSPSCWPPATAAAAPCC